MTQDSSNGRTPHFDPEDLARKVTAQAVYDRPLPKRFYKAVDLVPAEDGWELELDGKPVKIPSKQHLKMLSQPLAKAVAAEWEAQEEYVNPLTMPLTRLANTALNRVEPDRERIIEEVVSFTNSDLLCYRAEQPVELITRQTERWDPILDWFAEKYCARLEIVAGVMHREQSSDALGSVRNALKKLDSFNITGLHNVMALTGSAVLGFAAVRQYLPCEELWLISHIDEDWQIELWGPDEEEAKRRKLRFEEFSKTLEYLALLS